MTTKEVKAGSVAIGNKNPLVFIAGPCVIETEESVLKTANRLKEISIDLGIPLIFKSSYDKANRSSIDSYRGPGIGRGLEILEKVKKETSLPVLSDVHSTNDVQLAAGVLDVLQIPAFLCRQTDLIVAAAKTGKPVNIKKGQFLAPGDIKNSIDKVLSTGNKSVFVTERGVSFGYNNLVVDMRSIPIMQGLGFPVVFDATHAVQLPGGPGKASGGQREFAAPLARAAVAVGCDAVFLEVHESPDKALCDGPNMLGLDEFQTLAQVLRDINKLVKFF
ncbi:MAG TPA: 3-deoxy-8-phosphooctulonate synthase [Nitrospirae bacterium]|nr:2-dehydro-3-deoxyphosphooctonate aldolase [bacterium BMS3Bbin08]HDH50837.1 3-deoxy-8-phosphooctulonate synthase [Nitrospirota bacterium]HDK17064.1 3-deoxy-8-phosphooctulonate synthase [Nitrospirota bacterium]